MDHQPIRIHWDDGSVTEALPGNDWLAAAGEAGIPIPLGCLEGRCGACEIEVDGQVVRACIASVPASPVGQLHVALASDPHW